MKQKRFSKGAFYLTRQQAVLLTCLGRTLWYDALRSDTDAIICDEKPRVGQSIRQHRRILFGSTLTLTHWIVTKRGVGHFMRQNRWILCYSTLGSFLTCLGLEHSLIDVLIIISDVNERHILFGALASDLDDEHSPHVSQPVCSLPTV